MSKARLGIAGTATALAVALLLTSSGGAGDSKDLIGKVDKIADALQKGDKDGGKKQAETVAKKLEEVAEAMDLFKPRKKNGIGVGKTPGAITPDGIEQMLLKIGRDAPTAGTLKKDAEALERMGYHIAALGLISHGKTPASDSGKKTKKDWMSWSNDTVEAGLALANAAKAKSGADIKSAAAKANNACNSCHTVFR